MLKIGVIGYGNRIDGIVKKLLGTQKVSLAAVMDIDNDGVKEKYLSEDKNINYYDDAQKMLNAEKLDGVLIGTRCSTHAMYTKLVSKYDIPLFLEKPVCTNYEDLYLLEKIDNLEDKCVVSFPLRVSAILEYVKEIIDLGKIGEITHIEAYNNVNYARGYYHKWYRDENETGGLFLQKATHDIDYINYLLNGLKPVCITAMKSKQVFWGDKEEGLKCKDCPEYETCTESPKNVAKNGDGFVIGEYCCFAKDTGNEDSGSMLVEYENGMHVVYTQDFVVRNKAGNRGARIIGYKGTIDFDWTTNEVNVYQHLRNIKETHVLSTNGSHYGGDAVLCENFIGVMEGKEKSKAPLSAGILSAKMCLGAKKSSEEKVFVYFD